jgi:hypothetical protein
MADVKRDQEQEFERLVGQLDALEVVVDEADGRMSLIRPGEQMKPKQEGGAPAGLLHELMESL